MLSSTGAATPTPTAATTPTTTPTAAAIAATPTTTTTAAGGEERKRDQGRENNFCKEKVVSEVRMLQKFIRVDIIIICINFN